MSIQMHTQKRVLLNPGSSRRLPEVQLPAAARPGRWLQDARAGLGKQQHRGSQPREMLPTAAPCALGESQAWGFAAPGLPVSMSSLRVSPAAQPG